LNKKLFVFIVIAVTLFACGNPKATSTFEPTIPLTSTIEPTSTPPPATTPVTEFDSGNVAYETLSPEKVRISIPTTDSTLELSGRVTPSTLILTIDTSIPASTADNERIFIYDPLAVKGDIVSDSLQPITFEFFGGGGGSGTENGRAWGSDNLSFNVKTPLVIGQKIKVSIPITFDPKINEPEILLTIELTVWAAF
jgi:hypothetical protein